MDELQLKKRAIKQYCEQRAYCRESEHEPECPLMVDGEQPPDCYSTDDEEIINNHYKMLFESFDEEAPPVENDVIKHPNHYCREGAMECIDEMVLLFGKEVVKHFCLCNIWKYRYRSADKNGKQDIDKSDQYVRIYKELCNG